MFYNVCPMASLLQRLVYYHKLAGIALYPFYSIVAVTKHIKANNVMNLMNQCPSFSTAQKLHHLYNQVIVDFATESRIAHLPQCLFLRDFDCDSVNSLGKDHQTHT